MEGKFLSFCSWFLNAYADKMKPNEFPKCMPAEIVHSLNLDGPIQIFQYRNPFVHSLPHTLNFDIGAVFLKSFENNKK